VGLETLAIHIRDQNAALLITKEKGGQHRFEAFELLAPDDTVVGTVGRLRRQFPEAAVLVPGSHAEDFRFLETFTSTVVQLDRVVDSKSQEAKGDKAPGIDPDTADPRLVTGMILSMLHGLGSHSNLPIISKRTREEVFLESGHRSPWRRSALWLMIRVTLQLTLEPARLGQKMNPLHARETLYKDFMAYMMSQLLSEAKSSDLPHNLLFAMMAKISRRVLKLGSTEERPGFPLKRPGIEEAMGILNVVQSALKTRWEAVQSSATRKLDLSPLKTLDFQKDTMIMLPGLRKYVDDAMKRSQSNSVDEKEVPFFPGHHFRRNENRKYFPRIDFTEDSDFQAYELIEFESSVEEYLGSYGSHGAASRPLLGYHDNLASTTPGDHPVDVIKQTNSCYRHLQPGEVRLIRLQDGNLDGLVECLLEYCPLAEAPKFRALSYSLDTGGPCARLRLDSHSIQIPGDVHDALRHLRDGHRGDDDLYIWVDAICINQDDIDEKSGQVTRLRDIYSCAFEVLAWLGDSMEQDADWIALVCELSSGLTAADVYKTGEFSFDMSQRMDRFLKSNLLAPQELERCMVQMATRPWFSDVWSVGAASLPVETTRLMIGSHEVGLDKFSTFLSSWKLSGRFASPSLADTLDGPIRLEHIRQSYRTKFIPIREQADGQSPVRLAEELWATLRDTQHYRCRLPQDKIYGILSLTSSSRLPDSLAPNYRLHFTDPFRQYARFLYEQGGYLDAIQCPKREPAVPTWVPDFLHLNFEGLTPARAVPVVFSADGNKMTAKGTHIGEVAAVFPREPDSEPASPETYEPPLPLAVLTFRANRQKEHLDRECGAWKDLLLKEPAHLARRPESANPFHQMTHRPDTSRDYFVTFNGLVGICDGAVEGDMIVALRGSCRPVMMRRSESDFTVVGCAVLSGKFGVPETFSKKFFSRARKLDFRIV
jgi:hypothetical protein